MFCKQPEKVTNSGMTGGRMACPSERDLLAQEQEAAKKDILFSYPTRPENLPSGNDR